MNTERDESRTAASGVEASCGAATTLAVNGLTLDIAEWKGWGEPVFRHPPVDPWPFLPAVTCPTLVIHGEQSAVMDRAAAERVAAAVPRAAVTTLPGAFHHLVLDAPEAFVNAVDEWKRGQP
jgi:pimeloyl-ACP methyl ester carboxylesterase